MKITKYEVKIMNFYLDDETTNRVLKNMAMGMVEKGNWSFKNGKYEQAKAWYERALKADSECLEAYLKLATTYGKLGEEKLQQETLELTKKLMEKKKAEFIK